MKKSVIIMLLFALAVHTAAGNKKNSFFIIPAGSYSPETDITFILITAFFTNPYEESTRTPDSQISPLISYSLKNQSRAKLIIKYYFKNYDAYIESILQYKKFPEAFYGIGAATKAEDEEHYTAEKTGIFIEYHKRILSSLYTGLIFDFENNEILNKKEGGLLYSGMITGSESGKVSGAGLLLKWDSRNSTNFAMDGDFDRIHFISYGPSVGSDFNFIEYIADFRKYFMLTDKVSLAINPYLKCVTGGPHFNYMSLFGGLSRMRGYYEGRYRDSSMTFIQSELKIRVFDWFGLGLFAGAGDVFDAPSEFKADELKYSGGISLKGFVMPENDFAFRIDLAMGKNGFNFYVDTGDSF